MATGDVERGRGGIGLRLTGAAAVVIGLLGVSGTASGGLAGLLAGVVDRGAALRPVAGANTAFQVTASGRSTATTAARVVTAGAASASLAEVESADVPSDPAPATGRTFPLEDILPKREIGATDFLEDNPTYDGRGTIIAIFDTGVDPGAPGLQVTSDGRPKIIDVIDGTGSGDVDTSTVVERSEDGTIEGLTGRTLTVDPSWTNPTGTYRVGMKPAFELFPPGLLGRVRGERGEDRAERHRLMLVELRKALVSWDAEHPEPTRAQLEDREELAARLQQAEKMGSMPDPGPVFDCVVFNDGETWRAVIDTDEDGDLRDETVLTNFRSERAYATFDDEHLLNYVLNIYEDGDLLSVVIDVGAHGTHVAGIAAANYPDRPEKNGVAPGAQIVSVKIGDTRTNGSSTGTGTERGIIACIELGVDVMNMSYGGGTAFPNQGRINDLLREAVHDHGIVFVSSAGNSGPALTTVGSPGGTSDWAIGVGATVTPAMMRSMHQVRTPYGALQYTWSSRGPTADGALGVDITAPGGAIAPVPTWSHQGTMMMNGTSMSSPNLAGGLALLISGLDQNGFGHSPQCIKRAITATAEHIPGEEPWGEGAGMLRVDRAWEYLYGSNDRPDRDVFYEVSLPERDGARGVYLREPFEAGGVHEPYVDIRPRFPDDYDSRAKVDFEVLARIETTEPWISAPSHALISHGGDGFRFKIDARALQHGAHYAEVIGYDDEDPGSGPVFRVPITVVRPMELDPASGFEHREILSFEPGTIERRFVRVPAGATYADLAIRRLDDDTPSTIVVHMVQLEEDSSSAADMRQYVRFDDGDEEVRSIAVRGGGTLEVTLAQHWASLAERGRFEVELGFHGLVPDDASVTLDPQAYVTKTYVSATLRDEVINPSASLTHRHTSVTTSDSVIRPLADAERDELPEGRRIHELINTYTVKIEKSGSYAFYDNGFPGMREYASGMTQIYDENKRPIGLGGSWRNHDLGEGTYTVRVHYRHDDVTALGRVRDGVLHVRQSLPSPVRLRVHGHPDRAWKRDGSHGERELSRGQRAAVHIAKPTHDELGSAVKPGDVLTGSMTFGQSGADFIGAGRKPGGFAVSMVVGPKPETHDDVPEASDDDADEYVLTPEQELARDIRGAKLARLEKAAGDDTQDALFERLAGEVLASLEIDEPDADEQRRVQLEVLALRMTRAKAFADDQGQEPVIAAADAVIGAIDADAIAAHLALDHSSDDHEARSLTKRYTAERERLIEALHTRASALLGAAREEARSREEEPMTEDVTVSDAAAPDAVGDADSEAVIEEMRAAGGDSEGSGVADPESAGPTAIDRFEAAFTELDRWIDTTDEDYLPLHLDREVMRGRHAVALALVNKHAVDGIADRDMLERRIDLLGTLGWHDLAALDRNRLLVMVRRGYPRM